VLELAKTMGIPTLERPVDKSELFIADEVFLSGTAAKVTPVRRVENTDLSADRPVMDAIRDRLTAITEGRDPAFDHWVTRVRLNG
jgi:branched-chain amino acid aminotransferase